MPADLSANLGNRDRPDSPVASAAIENAAQTIRAAGTSAGNLFHEVAPYPCFAEMGVRFFGVSADATALASAIRGLAGSARRSLG